MPREQVEEVLVPQIRMTREVGLKINWTECKSRLYDVAAQGLLSAFGGDGISTAISALTGLAGGIKIDSDPGEKAWSLTMLSFAWALDEIKTLPSTNIDEMRIVLNDIIDDAKSKVESGNYFVPVDFLERPVTLRLYREMRDTLIKNKGLFRGGVNEDDAVLAARVDCAFERGIFEILHKKNELYKSLSDVLNSPGRQGAEKRLGWLAYRRRLISNFEVSPVFGQENLKLSLAQLYVPLRAVWPTRDEYEALGDYPTPGSHNICLIEDRILRWLREVSDSSDVLLVGGGPGSGKSTSLKSVARRVADYPDWHVLFIPLQYISLEGDLRDTINRYFTDRTGGPFTHPPLGRAAIEDGPPVLLIFDGLDELSRPGEGANEVVNLFAIKLANLLASLRGDGARVVKVVVSGRMPAFQVAKRYISPPRGFCLEVYGYTSEDMGLGSDQESLWNKDQRQEWWKKYSKLIGADDQVPDAFKSEQLRSITHEPLLCYLLVLSGFATENWEKAAENPNRIYKNLIDSVWYRGWGDGINRRQGAGKTLSRHDFNSLMQTIALAAWQGGDTRVASESRFKTAIGLARTERAWENFKADNGADVTNLAMNFYLKSPEGSHRGFEFTHKSFGDYLAARAIIDIAIELPPLINRNVDFAMSEWLQVTGTGMLTHEILDFMQDEIRLRMQEDAACYSPRELSRLKMSFERLVSSILADGLPAGGNSMTWRSAELVQRNAEVMAWAVLNSLMLSIRCSEGEDYMINIAWPDPASSLKNLLRRFSDIGDHENIAFRCFSGVNAPGSDLFGLSLMDIDFQGANLSDSIFSGCNLIRANLSGANLRGARLERAMLDQASLSGACLISADLSDARIYKTEMTNAELKDVIVSEGTLLYVDLSFFEANAHCFKVARRRPSYEIGAGDIKHMIKVKRFIRLIEDRRL